MEDKIEAGEYIRSKDGYIGRVELIIEDEQERQNYYICEKDNVMASNYKDNIVKHSKNIIDLIEVEDYVNGVLVISVEDVDKNSYCIPRRIILCNRDRGCTLPPLKIYEKDIKSIVTKEQFSDIEYKVGE